ncbi:MAG: flagellar type III secretion system pore protein FliP [Planctomycetota bacterium]
MTLLCRALRAVLVAVALLFITSVGALGASAPQAFPDLSGVQEAPVGPAGAEAPTVGNTMEAVLADQAREALMGDADDSDTGEGRLSAAVEIALLLTVLSLLPAVLVALTSFTRIIIVLSFVRRALSLNELPPNPVMIGLALFLTMFVMAPVGEELYEDAWTPYEAGEISVGQMGDRAWSTLSTFLVANTRENELRFFAKISGNETIFAGSMPVGREVVMASQGDSLTEDSIAPNGVAPTVDAGEIPLTVVVPAFILSELKTAFQMGFLLFLPFLVIDMVVSSVLLSMGMFMLPPVMISTPIKVLVFVLVDGWRLVTESVVTSFVMQTAG